MIMKKFSRVQIVLATMAMIIALGAPNLALTQTTSSGGTGDGNVNTNALPLTTLKNTIESGQGKAFPVGKEANDVFKVANAVIRVFFVILALVFLALMLYGGWNWMTAMGEDEKVTKGKDTIVAAIIGIIIIIAAYAVTTFVIANIYSFSVSGGT